MRLDTPALLRTELLSYLDRPLTKAIKQGDTKSQRMQLDRKIAKLFGVKFVLGHPVIQKKEYSLEEMYEILLGECILTNPRSLIREELIIGMKRSKGGNYEFDSLVFEKVPDKSDAYRLRRVNRRFRLIQG